jgi:hypothetical protein
LGGVRAFTGCPRLAEGWPSGLAVAPKVASAPRGPGSATLAGNPAQSLPQAHQKKYLIFLLCTLKFQKLMPF